MTIKKSIKVVIYSDRFGQFLHLVQNVKESNSKAVFITVHPLKTGKCLSIYFVLNEDNTNNIHF